MRIEHCLDELWKFLNLNQRCFHGTADLKLGLLDSGYRNVFLFDCSVSIKCFVAGPSELQSVNGLMRNVSAAIVINLDGKIAR